MNLSCFKDGFNGNQYKKYCLRKLFVPRYGSVGCFHQFFHCPQSENSDHSFIQASFMSVLQIMQDELQCVPMFTIGSLFESIHTMSKTPLLVSRQGRSLLFIPTCTVEIKCCKCHYMLSICWRHTVCKCAKPEIVTCPCCLSLSLFMHNYLKSMFSILSPFVFHTNNSIRQRRSILDFASLFINGLFALPWRLLYQDESFSHKWRDKQQSVHFMQSWKHRSACQFCKRVVLSTSNGALLISSSSENADWLLCKMSKRSAGVLLLLWGILSSLEKYQR